MYWLLGIGVLISSIKGNPGCEQSGYTITNYFLNNKFVTNYLSKIFIASIASGWPALAARLIQYQAFFLFSTTPWP